MPRLLLVDDNPSIHKIAETLLASSDVQLVSCGSGDQALALVEQGDRFDVALLDTTMAGMDGWALLRRLRETGPTRRMPVAMMAGVLDVVDPEQVQRAPIQGFLKKPVELRDLAERVRRLMETPVPEPPEEPAADAPEADDEVLLLGPGDLAPDEPGTGELEARDLEAGELEGAGLVAGDMESGDLELGDLALEPAGAVAGDHPEAGPERPDDLIPESEPLVLEELDLDELRHLDSAAPASPDTGAAVLGAAPADQPEPFTLPEFLLSDTLPELPGAGHDRVTAEALPDLGSDLDRPLAVAAPAAAVEAIDWTDESDSLVGLEPPPSAAALAATPRAAFPDSLTFADLLDDRPAPAPQAPTPAQVLASTPALAPAPAPVPAEAAGDPLAALLSNPVLLDRLAKAVVARLGDQVLREIAWEVMPELAERVRRQEAP
jgi:CheY-like chemotaxis protein